MTTHLTEGSRIPNITLITRTGDTLVCGNASGTWEKVSTDSLFANKRVIVFALPGAYTPTCSSTHLPGFDKEYEAIRALGIDEIYCISVNDAFVMHQWGNSLGVKNAQLLPDGNGDFSRAMGFLVKKENLGFGERSWRYSMVVHDGIIEKLFVEPGMTDNADNDPFEVSDANTMTEYLKQKGA